MRRDLLGEGIGNLPKNLLDQADVMEWPVERLIAVHLLPVQPLSPRPYLFDTYRQEIGTIRNIPDGLDVDFCGGHMLLGYIGPVHLGIVQPECELDAVADLRAYLLQGVTNVLSGEWTLKYMPLDHSTCSRDDPKDIDAGVAGPAGGLTDRLCLRSPMPLDIGID